jgi:hypothetical protein
MGLAGPPILIHSSLMMPSTLVMWANSGWRWQSGGAGTGSFSAATNWVKEIKSAKMARPLLEAVMARLRAGKDCSVSLSNLFWCRPLTFYSMPEIVELILIKTHLSRDFGSNA